MINHNIRKIIFDKAAFNQWKDNMRKINTEYCTIFIYCYHGYNDKHLSYIKNCKQCDSEFKRKIGSRDHVEFYQFIYIFNFNLCLMCENRGIRLPNKYWYSSGMDHSAAYKKIE